MRLATAEFIRNYGTLAAQALLEPLTITKNGRDRLVPAAERGAENPRGASNLCLQALRRPHLRHQRRHMLRRSLRHDPMAEVEDMRPSSHRIQHALRFCM